MQRRRAGVTTNNSIKESEREEKEGVSTPVFVLFSLTAC